MAKIHGVAGEWTRVKGVVLGLWPLFLGIFAIGVSTAMLFGPFVLGALLLVASILYCGWGFRRGLLHIERFFKGARGEEKVSGILKMLPDGYHIFNDYVASSRHIDHVVAGPTGIFAIETKFWQGRVTVEDGHILLDGQLPDRPPLEQVLKEAECVKQELAKRGWRREVTPVLVFASDTFSATIAELNGAVVMNSNHLLKSFAGANTVIEPSELDRLARIMEVES